MLEGDGEDKKQRGQYGYSFIEKVGRHRTRRGGNGEEREVHDVKKRSRGKMPKSEHGFRDRKKAGAGGLRGKEIPTFDRG